MEANEPGWRERSPPCPEDRRRETEPGARRTPTPPGGRRRWYPSSRAIDRLIIGYHPTIEKPHEMWKLRRPCRDVQQLSASPAGFAVQRHGITARGVDLEPKYFGSTLWPPESRNDLGARLAGSVNHGLDVYGGKVKRLVRPPREIPAANALPDRGAIAERDGRPLPRDIDATSGCLSPARASIDRVPLGPRDPLSRKRKTLRRARLASHQVEKHAHPLDVLRRMANGRRVGVRCERDKQRLPVVLSPVEPGRRVVPLARPKVATKDRCPDTENAGEARSNELAVALGGQGPAALRESRLRFHRRESTAREQCIAPFVFCVRVLPGRYDDEAAPRARGPLPFGSCGRWRHAGRRSIAAPGPPPRMRGTHTRISSPTRGRLSTTVAKVARTGSTRERSACVRRAGDR